MGFEATDQFPGFVQEEKLASIMVTEVPAPFADFSKAMEPKTLETRGMVMVGREPASLGGRPGFLSLVTQTAEGIVFEKWLGMVGDAETSVMIMALYPQAAADELRDSMREAVLSAVWEPKEEIGLLEGLSFRIEETPGLQIRKRIQNLLLLLEPGGDFPAGLEEAFLIVGSSHAELEIEDVESFARTRIQQTAQIKDLTNLQGEPVEVAGRSAFEITASATDPKTGGALLVYQLLIVDGTTYYIAQGMVGEKRAAEALPEFRSVARSLTILP